MSIVVLANKYKAHHINIIEDKLPSLVYLDTYNSEEILKHNPSLVIVFDEHWCELGNCVGSLKAANVRVLQIMDGILEWRRTWDYSFEGKGINGVINPLNQPALADKIACLGYKDYRILQSWGNVGKCEITGVPRLETLSHFRSDFSHLKSSKRKSILIVTAKTAYFTPAQHATTKQSLLDLKAYFDAQGDYDVVWRLSLGLDKEIGVENKMNDLTGMEIHEILKNVDAVITTPSTTILEAQLLKIPVAILDYHNLPHYVETAWSIYCKENIDKTMQELFDPPQAKLDYQEFLLSDQVYINSSSSDRLVTLIEGMLAVDVNSPDMNKSILNNIQHVSNIMHNDIIEYYDKFPVKEKDVQKLQIELSAAKGTISELYKNLVNCRKRIENIPFYKLMSSLRKKLK